MWGVKRPRPETTPEPPRAAAASAQPASAQPGSTQPPAPPILQPPPLPALPPAPQQSTKRGPPGKGLDGEMAVAPLTEDIQRGARMLATYGPDMSTPDRLGRLWQSYVTAANGDESTAMTGFLGLMNRLQYAASTIETYSMYVSWKVKDPFVARLLVSCAQAFHAECGADHVWTPDAEFLDHVVIEGVPAKGRSKHDAGPLLVWLVRATGNRPGNVARLRPEEITIEADGVTIRWRRRKASQRRGQRTTERYLFQWSCPPPPRAVDALKAMPRKTAIWPATKRAADFVTQVLRKAQGGPKNKNGAEVTSSVFRDTLDALLREEVLAGKMDRSKFRSLLDHSWSTSSAFYASKPRKSFEDSSSSASSTSDDEDAVYQVSDDDEA